MKFRPLHDRVLVRRLEGEEKTAGGIIIPDTAKEKPMEGEVVATGPGARSEDGKLHALDVKVGERILFGKWSGTEVKIEGTDLLILKESDIMASLKALAPAPRRRLPREGLKSWLRKTSNSVSRRASGCSVASTFSPMR